MKYGKKTITYLLCIVMLLVPVLSACEMHGGGETSEEITTEALVEETSAFLYSDRQMRYRIVYDAEGTSDVKNAAQGMYAKVSNYVDEKDFYGDDRSIAKGDVPEILIGETNRSESQDVMRDIAENTYRIQKVNGQIVICAAKQWMITDAVEAFMEQIEYSKDRKSATLPEIIDITYTYDGYTRDRWDLVLPAYEGGILADKTYVSNFGYQTMKGSNPNNYRVVCAHSTNAEEFSEYLLKLQGLGYTTESVNNDAFIESYWVTKGDQRMYLYHSKNVGEVRFVMDRNEAVTLPEFSYTYDKKSGDTTVLYQYGFYMSDHGKNINETYKDADGNKVTNTLTSNCGQMYIFKLADNSVMIIDGANHYQMPEAAAVGLNDFLHEITGTPDGEVVTISNWLITHSHLDHFGGFARFLYNYHDQYDIQRISFNFNYKDPNMPAFFNDGFNKWYPDVKYYRPHTGERIELADITIDVLSSYEDTISAKTGDIIPDKLPLLWGGEPKVDQNNSSITAKITFDGKTFLLLGDIAFVAKDVLLANYSDEVLKADILQVSHHGLNPIGDLYEKVKPSISLYSQKKEAAQILNAFSEKVYNSVVNCTQGGLENIYFQGNCTVGVRVDADGKLVAETRDVIGGVWDGEAVDHLFEKK